MKVTCSKHPQRGVTIVEGLVALVILSVGMLGIASLYVASLKTGRTALIRTDAINLVNGMIDSIRANGNAGMAYNLGTTPPTVQNYCEADGVCTKEQLAQSDLANWLKSVRDTLPGGTGDVDVTVNAPLPDLYQVSVRWREAGETQDYTYRASVEMLAARP